MITEEMEKLLLEPAVSLPAEEVLGQLPVAPPPELMTAPPGEDVLMLLDAILGVGAGG
jgi:hypothetical protein